MLPNFSLPVGGERQPHPQLAPNEAEQKPCNCWPWCEVLLFSPPSRAVGGHLSQSPPSPAQPEGSPPGEMAILKSLQDQLIGVEEDTLQVNSWASLQMKENCVRVQQGVGVGNGSVLL